MLECFYQNSHLVAHCQGYSMLPIFPKSDPSNTAEGLPLQYSLLNSSTSGKAVQCEGTDSSKLQASEPSIDPMNNRVMLVDGTAIMYRSYYKLLGNLDLSVGYCSK